MDTESRVSKKSWDVIRKVINRNKGKQVTSQFKYKDTIINDKQLIANKFNDYFINVGPSLAKDIPKSNKTPHHYLKNRIIESIYLTPVIEEEVTKIISRFKDSAAGWDDMKPSVIKLIKDVIKGPLTHVCNVSLTTGVFPEELKLANVVPIYKSGETSVFSNYRPVSVLPVFSKVLERLMYNRLLNFLNSFNVIYDYQFGFREKYATHMALITLVDKISTALDQGKTVVGIFLDFSKAFDTVDHKILLLKLEHYGIRGIALQWFTSYLYNRKQYVSYNGAKSKAELVKCGVPQGSILGPLLFLVYINDLCHVTGESFPILFADDSNLFYTSNNADELANLINKELQNVIEWLEVNRLSLNVKKTHYIIFTGRNRSVPDIEIFIKNNRVERVNTTKFLGVQIDHKLSWKCHIDYMNTKLSKCAGILCKARKILSKDTMLNLYYTFAYPYFTYCIHVWGKTYDSYLDKLVKTQKKLVRIITCSKYLAHTAPLYKCTGILTVPEIYEYTMGIFMYKYYYNDLPVVFRNMFMSNENVHSHGTRQRNDYHLPSCKSDVMKRAPSYQGCAIWNRLDDNMRSIKSLNVFKKSMRRRVLHSSLES